MKTKKQLIEILEVAQALADQIQSRHNELEDAYRKYEIDCTNINRKYETISVLRTKKDTLNHQLPTNIKYSFRLGQWIEIPDCLIPKIKHIESFRNSNSVMIIDIRSDEVVILSEDRDDLVNVPCYYFAEFVVETEITTEDNANE